MTKKKSEPTDQQQLVVDRSLDIHIAYNIIRRVPSKGGDLALQRDQKTAAIQPGILSVRSTNGWQRWNFPLNQVIEKHGLKGNPALLGGEYHTVVEITSVSPDEFSLVSAGLRKAPFEYARSTENPEMQRIIREDVAEQQAFIKSLKP